jgi:glucose/arabinose dehydrogenase/cytochrome c551/c552
MPPSGQPGNLIGERRLCKKFYSRGRLQWIVAEILVAVIELLIGATTATAAPLDVELEDLRPGLPAIYRSLAEKDAALARVDLKPAFNLGHSSPHPRIPAGPFEVTWGGIIFIKETPPLAFEAFVSGEVTVEIDGVTVLQGRGESDTSRVVGKDKLNRPIGLYRLRIQYRSLVERPARLQLWWEGPSFSKEPLPAWQLKHVAADLPKTLTEDELAEKGRVAVGRLGCARCHQGAFPGVTEPPPGPALADVGKRVSKSWLLDWLEDPAKVRKDARMPALFSADRDGFVERWLITEYLLKGAGELKPSAAIGDHRLGRRDFVNMGCTACHHIPDIERAEQPDFDRYPLANTGLGDRLPPEALAAFIANPHARYPDGRMPRLPMKPETARGIADYLLLWSKASARDTTASKLPTADEIAKVSRRLRARNQTAMAEGLIQEKGCARCHPGLGQSMAADVRIAVKDDSKGCLSGKGLPHVAVDPTTQKAVAAYRAIAPREHHPAPFAARQRLLDRSGCFRCHQHDSDRPPPLETISSTQGGAYLQELPFQRTPRLSYPLQKYTRAHVVGAVREGVTGLRPARFSYRMPSFGTEAETLVQALAEADGELTAAPDPPVQAPADPTLGTLSGSTLAGFQGYACVSCHIWNGQALSEADPGAVGTELTRLTGRIRRDWFERFLEDPARAHPGTPMPGIFPKGKKATLPSVLDGDPVRQKEALWSYFALGKDAPSPKPPPPLPVTAPAKGEPAIVAQIPLHLPGGALIESICVLTADHDLIIYDVGASTLHSAYTGGQILRNVQGRLRTFVAAGTAVGDLKADPPLQLLGGDKPEAPTALVLHGYDRLEDGVRIRRQAQFASGTVEIIETLRIATEGGKRRLLREMHFTGVAVGKSLELHSRAAKDAAIEVVPVTGDAKGAVADGIFKSILVPNRDRAVAATIRYELPPAKAPPIVERPAILADPGKVEGSLERPGYRAIALPRPKTVAGDDLIMPGAVAVNPKDGRLFVASMKLGEIFVLNDPTGDGKSAHFDNYARGLFQEAYSMLAESDALYVLHRRNLTKITETKGGIAERFERVAALPHGVGDTYDYGYGLARDPKGAFVFTYAPYANTTMPGSGNALRMRPGKPPEEVGYGFRNPFGWCSGPGGDVFFTDNQGEWVATNKLCHLVSGRFYGYPNPAQRQHTSKPFGKTACWAPYGWARSLNGVTYDNTGGKFGPFAGQFFLAELMYGGAIIRVDLEKVNGEYQGACFPFWGKGLLGPLTLAFSPKGPLYVGSITEPGWMAQPDRGAVYRIDYTGQTPFEMQTIRARPKGFRIVFTQPVTADSAAKPASYQVEHYRYEYTGAYGSPELDRTRVAIERATVAADGKSVELVLPSLVKDRIYLITARGVRSAKGEGLVHAQGAYTLNDVPGGGE